MPQQYPIGIFDSGYGGLTVLKAIEKKLPQFDYIYLGDNARSPYGTRSFDSVYQYTLQSVKWLFAQGCPLVILACNTASAKALRTIQQKDLPDINPVKRVLGVIRPTAEIIGNYSSSGEVGVLATKGTVVSDSYKMEINRFFPDIKVYQEACPMWVPLVENGEHMDNGADYFIKKNLHEILSRGKKIDVLLLACTHYPLLIEKITEHLPVVIKLLSQGEIVADSLAGYLERHPEIEDKCSKTGCRSFFTTDDTSTFDRAAGIFYGKVVTSNHVELKA